MGKSLVPAEMTRGEYLFKRYGATVADYERAADEDTWLDLCDGVLVLHSPASVRHERIFRFLLALLDGFVRRRQWGEVFGARTPMFLGDERRFEPDLIFVKTAHAGRIGEVAIEGPADLVIEILSPATRDYDLGEKRRAYAEGGVPEYWMIDASQRLVRVDRPAGTQVAELGSGRVETPALPGFWLDASWLWPEPPPDPAACLAAIG
ncbi:MAG: Uma2 family endonuclease [Phycisphaerales bacterium]|nr:Uma2 family endonuclease [Phycisphaerales bacterium]